MFFFFFFYLTACHRTSPVVRGSKNIFRVFFTVNKNIYYNDTIERVRRKLGKLAYAVGPRWTDLCSYLLYFAPYAVIFVSPYLHTKRSYRFIKRFALTTLNLTVKSQKKLVWSVRKKVYET
jgi:hypothetical protein